MSLGLIAQIERAYRLADIAKHYPVPIPVDDNGTLDHGRHARNAVDWASTVITESLKLVKDGNSEPEDSPQTYQEYMNGD